MRHEKIPETHVLATLLAGNECLDVQWEKYLLHIAYLQIISEYLDAVLSNCLSVRPSHCCLEHISKSIEGDLMKLDTLIEGHEENCTMQET